MFELKNDQYRRARGGKAFVIVISCTCGAEILTYQKDGDGKLKRCYFNRILAPETLEKLQHDPRTNNPKGAPKLSCPKCSKVIGAPITHFDGRTAFRLRQGEFAKRRVTS
jgi:hypothetical protein